MAPITPINSAPSAGYPEDPYLLNDGIVEDDGNMDDGEGPVLDDAEVAPTGESRPATPTYADWNDYWTRAAAPLFEVHAKTYLDQYVQERQILIQSIKDKDFKIADEFNVVIWAPITEEKKADLKDLTRIKITIINQDGTSKTYNLDDAAVQRPDAIKRIVKGIVDRFKTKWPAGFPTGKSVGDRRVSMTIEARKDVSFRPNLPDVAMKGNVEYAYPIPPYDLARSFSGKTQIFVPSIATGDFKQGYFVDISWKHESVPGDETMEKSSFEFKPRIATKLPHIPGYWTIGVGGAFSSAYNKDYDPDFDPESCDDPNDCEAPPQFNKTDDFVYSAEWLMYPKDVVKGNLPILGLTFKGKGTQEYTGVIATNSYLPGPTFDNVYLQGAFTTVLVPGKAGEDGEAPTPDVFTYNPTGAFNINIGATDPRIVDKGVLRVEGGAKVTDKIDSEEGSLEVSAKVTYGTAIPGFSMPSGDDAISLVDFADGYGPPLTLGVGLVYSRSDALGSWGFDAPEDISELELEVSEGDFVADDELKEKGYEFTCREDWPDPEECYQRMDHTEALNLAPEITLRTKPGDFLMKKIMPGAPEWIATPVKQFNVTLTATAKTDVLSLDDGPLVDDWSVYSKFGWQFK